MGTNAHVNNHMHTDMHVRVHTYMHTHMCMLSLSLSHMHALSSHVTVKDLSSSYNELFPASASVHTETRQIICFNKMYEKQPQKTHMLSEVAD